MAGASDPDNSRSAGGVNVKLNKKEIKKLEKIKDFKFYLQFTALFLIDYKDSRKHLHIMLDEALDEYLKEIIVKGKSG
jgi:hypothetical protein